MKKLIAITLTVIMLMTALPFNSFALFSKLPKVKNITFETDDPIYYSILKAQLEDLYEQVEEDGELFYEDFFLTDICYHLDDYEITLEYTNGTSETIDTDMYYGDDYDITVFAEVDLEDAVAAVEAGATSLPVSVYAYIDNEYNSYESDKYIIDFDVADSYFKEIEYVSGLPEEISEFEYNLDLTGYKFKVTYADGTEKTVVLESNEDGDFLIDGKYIYCDIDVENQEVDFECFDAKCSADANIIDYPFYNIYILDYSLDEDGYLNSIVYEIYFDDETSETFTVEDVTLVFPEEEYESPYAVVGQISGLDIIVRSDVEIIETDPQIIYNFISIEIDGTDVMDSMMEYTEGESTNPIRAFLIRLVNAFYRIVDFFRNLFAR